MLSFISYLFCNFSHEPCEMDQNRGKKFKTYFEEKQFKYKYKILDDTFIIMNNV